MMMIVTIIGTFIKRLLNSKPNNTVSRNSSKHQHAHMLKIHSF